MNMTAVAIAILAAATVVLIAAAWFADQAGKHARSAAYHLRDVKRAIGRWGKASGVAVQTDDLRGQPEPGARHFGRPGRATGWGRE